MNVVETRQALLDAITEHVAARTQTHASAVITLALPKDEQARERLSEAALRESRVWQDLLRTLATHERTLLQVAEAASKEAFKDHLQTYHGSAPDASK